MAGVVLLATACQPTPEQTAVVNRGDGRLEEIISGAPLEEAASLEEYTVTPWEETYTVRGLTAHIAPEVILGEGEVCPVWKVRQRSFHDAELHKIVSYFTEGADGMKKMEPTKQDLMDQLVQAKRGQYVLQDGEEKGSWVPYEGQAEEIAELERRIANAPEERFDSVDIESLSISRPDAKTFIWGDGSRAHISFRSDNIYYNRYYDVLIQPESWITEGFALPDEPAGTTITTNLTEEEARQAVMKCVEELGLENLGIARLEKARVIPASQEILSTGWLVTLTRNDGGRIPVDLDYLQDGLILNFFQEETYIDKWPQEFLQIYVDEDGISGFEWRNPLEITETMNENVTLLNFEQLKEQAKKAIRFGFDNNSEAFEGTEGTVEITIHTMTLCNLVQQIKDDTESRMLAPAWLFYYSVADWEEDNMFGISAIDGSFLDLSMWTAGYATPG